MKEQKTIVQLTTKDPKKIAAGKKLAEHNRKKREELANTTVETKNKTISGGMMSCCDTGSVYGTLLEVLLGVAIMGGYVYRNYIPQKQQQVVQSINQSTSPSKIKKFEMD